MHYRVYLTEGVTINVQFQHNTFHSVLFCSLFPSVVDEHERLTYKREFDRDHQEYKSLQAELDSINQDLAHLDQELDRYPEGSPQFLVSAPCQFELWFL